jgi:hypothetical protein
MLALLYSIERAKLQIDHKEPAKSFAQHKKYRRLMGHSIGLLALGLVIALTALNMQSLCEDVTVPGWILVATLLAPTVTVSGIA